MRRQVVTATGFAALALAGCGGAGSQPTAQGPCSTQARAAIARAAGTPATATAFTAPSGAPSCRFVAGRLGVQAGIDSAPQAYARLEREAVEYGQTVIWSHQGPAPYPQNVEGLGQAADWFPRERRLLATDGARLVAITVTGATPARARALAEGLARGYLTTAVPR